MKEHRMTSTKTLVLTAIACGLLGASVAQAGPGSVPEHLLRQPEARRQDSRPAHALTGRTERRDDWRVRAEFIGGSRDQRTVFDRGPAR